MPHREADYKEICALCRERTENACPRCAVPICEQHVAKDRRCPACEEFFRDVAVRERAEFGHTIAQSMAFLACVTLGIYLVPVAVPFAILGLFSGVTAVHMMRTRTRRRFLAETPTKRFLSVPARRLLRGTRRPPTVDP